MNKKQTILDRINELQQIIDRETPDADAGCDWSKSLVINAEIEKEKLARNLAGLMLFFSLFAK